MWQNRRQWAKAFISMPVSGRIWDLEKQHHQYCSGFIESIESATIADDVIIRARWRSSRRPTSGHDARRAMATARQLLVSGADAWWEKGRVAFDRDLQDHVDRLRQPSQEAALPGADAT